MSKKIERTRRWVFVENNPVGNAQELIDRLTTEYSVRYAVVGNEVAPETGTVHLQGFIEFEHPATFEQIKGRIPRAHIEPALGSNKQNRIYCTKGNDFVEVGTLTRRVQTSEIANEVVRRILVEGQRPEAIAVESPELSAYVVQHYISLKKMYEAGISFDLENENDVARKES